MGHEIHYDIFSIKKSKSEISAAVNERAVQESDSHSELYYNIRWYDTKCFDTKEQAEAFIESIDRSYAQIAVCFKYQKNFKASKALETLSKRLQEAYKAFNDLQNKPHFAEHKSELIGCKYCNSKIATKYMKNRNTCPVCGKDLRPESTLTRIANLNTIVNDLIIFTLMIKCIS